MAAHLNPTKLLAAVRRMNEASEAAAAAEREEAAAAEHRLMVDITRCTERVERLAGDRTAPEYLEAYRRRATLQAQLAELRHRSSHEYEVDALDDAISRAKFEVRHAAPAAWAWRHARGWHD